MRRERNIKRFVFGRYPWNPKINSRYVEALRGGRSEMTTWMSDEPLLLMSTIGMRARLSRYLAVARRRLLRGV